MALNPNIILAGQTPDIIGAMDRGRVAAEGQINLNRQNALAQLYQTQGAGIAAGDQGGLNALAQFDPMAAQGVQQNLLGQQEQRLGMDQTRQQMAVLDERTKREAEQYARSIGAEKAAQEAAELEGAVKQAMMAPTPEAFDAMMTQMGRPEMVGMFEDRDDLAAQFLSVAEILKMNAPPEPMAPGDRYKVAGSTMFDIGAEGGPKAVGQGQMQETTVFGADGKPVMVQGAPGAGFKFTEGQSKDNVFATRAAGALAALEGPSDPNDPASPPLASALTSLGENVAERVPLVGNFMLGDTYQTARTSGDEFLQAILRKDTGAAITVPEQKLYGVTYLPQPGDGPRRLAYKKEARMRAVEAIKSGMNAQQIEAMARADAGVIAGLDGDTSKTPKANATKGSKPPEGIEQEVWDALTDGDRALWAE